MSWMMRQSSRASPGTLDCLVHLDDAPFDLRHRAFVFLVQAARKDDVRMVSGVVQEEIDGDEELELLQAAGHERVVGQRHLRVEADREQALDFARVDLPEQLVGIDARAGNLPLVHLPHAGRCTCDAPGC